MATYTLIEAKTLTSSVASVTFSAIPSTYTDLVLRMSTRVTTTGASVEGYLTFNGSTSNFTWTLLYGTGTAVGSNRYNTNPPYVDTGSGATSDTFANTEIYIPSYTKSQNKPFSTISMPESNAISGVVMYNLANLWSNTAAITSLTLTATGNYVSGSSFYLYGISNA